MSKVFAKGPDDKGSIPDQVIPKTPKMVLDAALLNMQNYKVRMKREVVQSREWSSVLPYTLVLQLLEWETSGPPTLRLPTLLIIILEYSYFASKPCWLICKVTRE